MPFTSYALDTFVAQDMSKLKECNAKAINESFEQSQHWLGNFVLNSTFRVHIPQEHKPFILTFLRRAEMALLEYERGRKALEEYVKGASNHISRYFQALHHFEITINLLYQAYELVMKKLDIKLFTKNDSSPLERLNRVYNVIKHAELSSIPEGNLHPVWLRNEGVFVSTAYITFDELYDILIEIGNLADKLSNPELPDEHEGESSKEQ